MTAPTSQTPNPGSDGAIAQGCTCPVVDNGHGRGYLGMPGVYVFSGGCPLHGNGVGAPAPQEAPDGR